MLVRLNSQPPALVLAHLLGLTVKSQVVLGSVFHPLFINQSKTDIERVGNYKMDTNDSATLGATNISNLAG